MLESVEIVAGEINHLSLLKILKISSDKSKQYLPDIINKLVFKTLKECVYYIF